MDNPNKLKELVKKLVRISKTKEALELIEREINKLSEDYTNIENSISVLLAELNYANEQLRNGIFNYVDYSMIIAKINHSTLKMVDEIKVNNNVDYAEQNYEINQNIPFGIKEGNRIKIIRMLQIGLCKSDGNFTHVHLTSGDSIFSSYTLKNMEEKLPSVCFFRCHREYLINGYYIKEYDRAEGGYIKMQNGDTIPISRGRRKNFNQFFQAFLYKMEMLTLST